MAPPLELEQTVLQRSGKREGAEIRFCCPYPERHKNGDQHPSARYHLSKHVWHCDVCEAGGGWRELAELLDVPIPRRNQGRPEVVATYEYRDEAGEVLRRKVRLEPGFKGRSKSFTWEEPDGQGGWTKSKGKGNPQLLYHSKSLLAARETQEPVLVVEGEKDADRAQELGLVAVCNPEGAGRGKWKPKYSRQLRGLDVVVIPDKDDPGRAHATAVANSLQDVAESVRMLELPGEKVKDLSDWADDQERRGHTGEEIAAELERLAKSAPIAMVTEDDDGSSVLEELEQLGEKADLGDIENLLRRLKMETTGLDDLGRELTRERAVKALKGKVQRPGRMVDTVLKSSHEDSAGSGQGRTIYLDDPEPWPGEVAGAELLDEFEKTFQRYLVLPEGAAPALALWTLHTYAHDAATISPLLAVTSPEKRCGKTTLLSLLIAMVRRALQASNITPAALFRAVEHFQPTLVVDEADSFLRERDELRGILNSGHTREGAFVIRTAGDDHEPRQFSTWAPKVIALIGRLPTTLEDRSIPVAMKRKAPGETVERLRLDRIRDELADLRRRAVRWVEDHAEGLSEADPELPEGLHDRARDNWRPLIAIADEAGGDWAEKARMAANHLSEVGGEDSSIRVKLLSDIRDALTTTEDGRLFTQDLLRVLAADESKPWGEFKAGKPLTAIKLSRLLKPFGVGPKKIRIGTETRQGYQAEDLADTFARYLSRPQTPGPDPEHPEQVNNDGSLRDSATRNKKENVPGCQIVETPAATGFVPSVPACEGEDPQGDTQEREVFEI